MGTMSAHVPRRLELKLHPQSRCEAVTRIAVEIVRAGDLMLRYSVAGAIGELRLPDVTAPARTDGLWRHSCFEAFVRPMPGTAYYEFNFAPSTCWAGYRFSGYREGMAVADEIAAPHIAVKRDEDFELQASLPLGPLGSAPWRLGLSAVIEETNGRLSYWALAHPPAQPDFHHSVCFTLELPAA